MEERAHSDRTIKAGMFDLWDSTNNYMKGSLEQLKAVQLQGWAGLLHLAVASLGFL